MNFNSSKLHLRLADKKRSNALKQPCSNHSACICSSSPAPSFSSSLLGFATYPIIAPAAILITLLFTPFLFNDHNDHNDHNDDDEPLCPACDGTGYIPCLCTRWELPSQHHHKDQVSSVLNRLWKTRNSCDTCSGRGRTKCPRCRGGGTLAPEIKWADIPLQQHKGHTHHHYHHQSSQHGHHSIHTTIETNLGHPAYSHHVRHSHGCVARAFRKI